MATNRLLVMGRVKQANIVLGLLNMDVRLWYDQKTGKLDAKLGGSQIGLNLVGHGERVGNNPSSLGIRDELGSVMLAQLARWARSKTRYPLSQWARWIGPDHPALAVLSQSDYDQKWMTRCIDCGHEDPCMWSTGRRNCESGPVCKTHQAGNAGRVSRPVSQAASPRIGYGLGQRPSQCPTSSRTCEPQLSARADGSRGQAQDGHASSVPWE